MSALLSRIKAHAEPDLVRKVSVPEWALEDGKPLIITYTMVTLDDLSVVIELDGSGDFNKHAARIVAMKACDESGNRLFKIADATVIRTTADPTVVKRIAMSMLARTTIEDAEKN